MPRRSSFADFFSVFTSRDEDEVEEDDPLTELIKRREAERERKKASAPSSTRDEVSKSIETAQGDVLVDEELGIEVKGNLDPLTRASIRDLFSRLKAQRAPKVPPWPAPAPAKREVTERRAPASMTMPSREEEGEEEDLDDELDGVTDEDEFDDDDEDDVVEQMGGDRFQRSREFEEEIAAIRARQAQRVIDRESQANPPRKRRTKKRRR